MIRPHPKHETKLVLKPLLTQLLASDFQHADASQLPMRTQEMLSHITLPEVLSFMVYIVELLVQAIKKHPQGKFARLDSPPTTTEDGQDPSAAVVNEESSAKDAVPTIAEMTQVAPLPNDKEALMKLLGLGSKAKADGAE